MPWGDQVHGPLLLSRRSRACELQLLAPERAEPVLCSQRKPPQEEPTRGHEGQPRLPQPGKARVRPPKPHHGQK